MPKNNQMTKSKNDDQICALCKYNTLVQSNTHCGNFSQTNKVLKEHTNYNNSCSLFKLRDESFYDDERSALLKPTILNPSGTHPRDNQVKIGVDVAPPSQPRPDDRRYYR